MSDDSNPYQSSPTAGAKTSARRMKSVFVRWCLFYLALAVILVLTTPATSRANSWNGIVPGFFFMLFGAFGLARAGAKVSTAFIFGCSTSFLFFFRFLMFNGLSWWLEHDAPPTFVLMLASIAFILFLGCAASGIAYVTHDLSRSDQPQA